MKYLHLNIILLLISNLLLSQPISEVRGVIIDKETKMPIGGVIVYLYVKGVPSTFTNSNGSFMFDVNNLGIDINGSYNVAFYKPGYENTTLLIDFPIKKPIGLKKSPSGFIQILETDTNRFLDGIVIGYQDGKPDTTDRFGFFKIEIPPGASPDKNYRIAIKGGCCFDDVTANYKASDLRDNIVSMYLTPKTLRYFDLVEAFEDELDKVWQGLLQENVYEQSIHLDKCSNYINKIQSLKSLSKEEKDDYRIKVPLMISVVKELNNINLNIKVTDIIEKKHKESTEKFKKLYNSYTSHPPALADVPKKMEELFYAGFVTLKLSVDRWKVYPNGIDLVKSDKEQLVNLIKHIENIKINKIPSNYPNRQALIDEFDNVILQNSKNLHDIIQSMK